jgi:hypothetical protein
MLDIILTFGIPTAITGLILWFFKRWIDKKEARRDEKERNTEKLMLLLIKTSRANTILCEAIAKAVQRIPDAQCNGDMTSALERATAIRMEEKDFILNEGIKHIFE